MDFQELFNRITYGLPVDKGLNDTKINGRSFWTAEGPRGMIKYSKSPKREIIWGHDHLIVHPATNNIVLPIYASHMRVNEDGSTSIAIEPGYIEELIPRMTVVPEVARAFSPVREAEEAQQMRFELPLEDICSLFRSAYVTQASYQIPSSSSYARNQVLNPGRNSA